MTIELATIRFCEKTWGRMSLQPWSNAARRGHAIGEMSFERKNPLDPKPSLLFKILFTSAALSIQVHPDDCFAERIGLRNGKAEAWYILSADPGSRVALGLKQHMTRPALRAAIVDGTIETLIKWREVHAGDVISVPPGTIHAIGAGIVIAEIQQNSDSTYRLFDYGSSRELHIDQSMAVANAEIFTPATEPEQLGPERKTLVITQHFVLEHIELPPDDVRTIRAEQETWLLVLDGNMTIDGIEVSRGEAIMLERTTATIQVGCTGLTVLVAYASAFAIPDLLGPPHRAAGPSSDVNLMAIQP